MKIYETVVQHQSDPYFCDFISVFIMHMLHKPKWFKCCRNLKLSTRLMVSLVIWHWTLYFYNYLCSVLLTLTNLSLKVHQANSLFSYLFHKLCTHTQFLYFLIIRLSNNFLCCLFFVFHLNNFNIHIQQISNLNLLQYFMNFNKFVELFISIIQVIDPINDNRMEW